MAYIQKVKNKSGTSYRAYIKQSGYKRITKTFNTKSKAEKFINSVINNRDLIEVLSSQNNQLSISQIITEYLSNIYKGTRPNTESRRLQYWIDKIGHKKVSEVSKFDVMVAFNQLPQKLSNATKNRYKSAISSVFSYAVRTYDLSVNPVSFIQSLRENNERVRYLSKSEKDRLLNECQNSSWNKLYLIVLMAITTGARKGELERLKWSDIDFDRGLAYVHQTKNGEPRVLPLTKQVLNELGRVGRDAELIFNSSIKPTKAYEFRKEWIKALNRAEIDDFRFHDLRHTCASYLAQNGASLLEIADVLGHKQIQMSKRYAHLCVSHKQKLIEKYFGEI